MAVVVITGGSRGIGLELTRVFLRNGHKVVSVCRDEHKAVDLLELKESYGGENLLLLQFDVTQPFLEIDMAMESIINSGFASHIDILINNAGVVADVHPNDDMIKTSVEEFSRVLMVNTVGPFAVTKAALRWLHRSKQVPIIVNMSSSLGSIARNSGTPIAYGASKAALNYLTMSLARLHSQWICVAMSPGWVQTDMGNYGNRQAHIPVTQCATTLYENIRKLKITDSGAFIHHDGSILPW